MLWQMQLPSDPAADVYQDGRTAAIKYALNQNAILAKAHMQKSSVGGVGTVLQGQGFVSGDGGTGVYAPLVPQDIQTVVSSQTFVGRDMFTLCNMMFNGALKQDVSTPLHEKMLINEYGGQTTQFFDEGGIVASGNPEYERKAYRVRFSGAMRRVTDVAMHTSLIGTTNVSLPALNEATRTAGIELLEKSEYSLAYSSNAVDPLAYDGIITQIKANAPQNVRDYRNGLSLEELLRIIVDTNAPPNFGRVNTVLLQPKQYQSLIQQLFPSYRIGLSKEITAGSVTFGEDGLSLMTGNGQKVSLVSAPLVKRYKSPPTAASGTGAPNAGTTPAITMSNLGATSGSLWTSTEAGTYQYHVMAHGRQGHTLPITTSSTAVAAGEALQLSIADGSVSGIVYYDIWRRNVVPSGAQWLFLGSFATNTLGGSSATLIVDKNEVVAGSSSIIGLTADPQSIQWLQMLPVIRRPIATLDTTTAILLMMFGTPAVHTPRKHFVLESVPEVFA